MLDTLVSLEQLARYLRGFAEPFPPDHGEPGVQGVLSQFHDGVETLVAWSPQGFPKTPELDRSLSFTRLGPDASVIIGAGRFDEVIAEVQAELERLTEPPS